MAVRMGTIGVRGGLAGEWEVEEVKVSSDPGSDSDATQHTHDLPQVRAPDLTLASTLLSSRRILSPPGASPFTLPATARRTREDGKDEPHGAVEVPVQVLRSGW